MLLESSNAYYIKMKLRLQFFTYWKENNIPSIKKQTRQTDRYVIKFGEFTLLSFESQSVFTSFQYVSYFMMRINEVQG